MIEPQRDAGGLTLSAVQSKYQARETREGRFCSGLRYRGAAPCLPERCGQLC